MQHGNEPGGRVRRSHPLDVLVGSRLQLRRKMLRLSQQKLGEALGVTFQQIQKYESGTNRIGASRLCQIAKVLEVPIGFFFDDTDPVRAPAITAGSDTSSTSVGDVLQHPETIELVTAYYRISHLTTRRLLFDLAKALAANAELPAKVPGAKHCTAEMTRLHSTRE